MSFPFFTKKLFPFCFGYQICRDYRLKGLIQEVTNETEVKLNTSVSSCVARNFLLLCEANYLGCNLWLHETENLSRYRQVLRSTEYKMTTSLNSQLSLPW